MKTNQLVFILSGVLILSSCEKKSGLGNTSMTQVQEKSSKISGKPAPASAGVTLSADGPGNTYSLINSVLANPGGNVLETPDCAHPTFGDHITEVFDATLNKNVFAFFIHMTPDDDKCNGKTDRQRNEIKTYDQSPANVLASHNENITYKWKFKLDAGFQASPNFTHLHQIKPIDGDNQLPIITITARHKTSGGQYIEVIHTGGTGKGTSQGYLASIPLADFKGQWVEVTEISTFSFNGKYKIDITRISDGKVLLSKQITGIDMWRDGTTLSRPKWGIYRSLLSPTYLRDEIVYFNDFNITEL